MTLRDIKPGQIAIIKEINIEGPIKSRLMTLGLIKGTEVKVQRLAPLGDPMQIRVRGYDLSFRRSDAENIKVEYRKEVV